MYRFAEFHQYVGVGVSLSPALTRYHLGLAADHEHAGLGGAQGAGQLDHLDRVHPVGVERDRPIFFDLRLDEVDGARLPATRGGVDEDDQVVIFEHRVREVHPPDAEVDDLDALGQSAPGEPLYYLDPETIVAQEYVADTGDQDPLTHREPRSSAARPPRVRRRTGARESAPLPGPSPDRPPASPRCRPAPRSLALCPRRARPFL